MTRTPPRAPSMRAPRLTPSCRVPRATVEGQLRAQQADEEGRILAEIERRDKAQLRHRLELQKLCEESEELRVLREKLRMAQTTFERSRQRDEAAMIERKEREYEAALHEAMERRLESEREAELERERRRHEDFLHAKAVLVEQMEVRASSPARRELRLSGSGRRRRCG